MVTVEVTSSTEPKFTEYKDSYGYEIYVGDKIYAWQPTVVYEGTVQLVGDKFYFVGNKKYLESIAWQSVSVPLSNLMRAYTVANASNPNVKVTINSEDTSYLSLVMQAILLGLVILLIIFLMWANQHLQHGII